MSEWISVEDRLPNKYENVLVVTIDGEIYVCQIVDTGVGAMKAFETEYDEYILGVTHWMPLPEPPKENE